MAFMARVPTLLRVEQVNGSESQLRVRAGAQYNLTLSHDPQVCEQ